MLLLSFCIVLKLTDGCNFLENYYSFMCDETLLAVE